MSTANKLNYISETKNRIKTVANYAEAGISADTFRSYPEKIYNSYINALNGDINMPKLVSSGISIDLTNAIDKPFTDFNLEGNTQQDSTILPSEYQQVEYIQNSSGVYINTNFIPKQNTNAELKAEMLYSGTRYLFGVSSSTNRYMIAQQSTGSRLIADLYSSTYRVDSGIVGYETGVHTIKVQNKSMYIDGVLKGTSSCPDFTCEYPAYLFAANNGSSAQVSGQKIYYFKMWDNITLVRDMIPCYRKSDNEIGMYDLVNNVFYTNAGTGTFTKGNNVILPTPDYPQSINVVTGRNDMSWCGKNLFDKDTTNFVKGYYLNTNGIETSGTNWGVYYIPIIPNKSYTISGCQTNGGTNFCWFDSTKTFISRIGQKQDRTNITSPNNASFLGLSVVWNTSSSGYDATTLMVEQNSTASTYEPYIGYTQEINLGKNLFDKSNANIINGYFATSVNDIITSNNSHRTLYIKCDKDTTYTIQKSTSGGSLRFGIGTTKETPQVSTQVYQTQYNNNESNLTITTNSEAKYLVVWFYNTNSTITLDDMLASIQIEKGNQVTSYSEYFTPIELCKISTYQDFIREGTGKNLFDESTLEIGSIDATTGQNTVNNTEFRTSGYISVESATNYTLSNQNYTTYTHRGIFEYDKDYNYIKRTNDTTASTTTGFTLQTSSTTKYVRIRYIVGSVITEVQTNMKTQYEKNSTQTEYEPYGFKDKWYIHKEIGKVVLDGSEDWAYQDTYPRFSYYFGNNWDTGGENHRYEIYSNYFHYASSGNADGIGFVYAKQLYLYNYDYTTPTDFKTWLGTTKPNIYFVLNTPIDTEITNEELLGQLNNLINTPLLKGLNHITVSTENKQPTLNVETIKDYNTLWSN